MSSNDPVPYATRSPSWPAGDGRAGVSRTGVVALVLGILALLGSVLFVPLLHDSGHSGGEGAAVAQVFMGMVGAALSVPALIGAVFGVAGVLQKRRRRGVAAAGLVVCCLALLTIASICVLAFFR